MTPLEKDIEKSMGRRIGAHGGHYMKWVCPGFAGVPDRICLLPGGRVIFIELKRPAGSVVAERQKYWLSKLRSLGFEAVIVASHEDVKNFERTYLNGEH